MPEYTFTDNEKIPVTISDGKHTSPVWIQQLWDDGEYASFIRNNGCGHCCAAMALNLRGIDVTPYEEFELCRRMWGVPDEKNGEYNYQSVSGITKVMRYFDVECEYFGVPHGKSLDAERHIKESLGNGKLVIFWSHPSDKLPDNPFSTGEHYVLAFGIDEENKIYVANSSNRVCKDGVQIVDADIIREVLFEGSEPKELTWGRADLKYTGGYVVIE